MTPRWRAVARSLAPAAGVLVLQLVFFPMPVGALLSGAITGTIAALGAVGIALIWRANRIVNFAQGDLGVFPATLAVLLVTLSGLPWLLGVGIGLVTAIAVGLAVDLLIMRRFFRAPRLLMTVATIGLSQILGFCALILPNAWGEGPEVRTLDRPVRVQPRVGRRVLRRQRPDRRRARSAVADRRDAVPLPIRDRPGATGIGRAIRSRLHARNPGPPAGDRGVDPRDRPVVRVGDA